MKMKTALLCAALGSDRRPVRRRQRPHVCRYRYRAAARRAKKSIPAPRVGFVWAPGYWNWQGHRHVWVKGHYIHERHGHHWVNDNWEQRDGRWHYERGHWD